MLLRLLLSFSIAFTPILEATKFTYHEIDDFKEIHAILNKNSSLKKEAIDLFFCDLDGVIVKEHADQENAIPINNNSKDFFTKVKSQNHKIFGLTARDPEKNEITSQNLFRSGIDFNKDIFNFTDLSINYHNGVFYSPDKEKNSTKLQTIGKIIEYFKNIKHQIRRIIFIDNEKRHFESNYKEKFSSEEINFFFFNYQRKYEPFHGFCNVPAPNLSNLQFVKHIDSAGSGGVYVFTEGETNKRWTVKSWKKKKQGYNECLGAEIYSKIGGHAPGYYMYDDLPLHLKKNLPKERTVFYRLAEFIEGENPSEESLKENFSSCFMPLGFISSWDIKPSNFIVKDAKFHLIDFGSAFDSRGFGHDKIEKNENSSEQGQWIPSQFSEISTFFKYKSEYCTHMTRQLLNHKINTFVFNKNDLIKSVKDFCNKGYHNERKNLVSFIENRSNHLHFLHNLQKNIFNTKADPFQKARVGDAAGAIPYCVINGTVHFLGGKRRGNQLWEIGFGGKADAGEYLLQTASRELSEELGRKLNLGDFILESPCHDTLYAEDKNNILFTRYRSYLVKIDKFLDPKTIQDAEHSEFAWIPVADIQEALKEKNSERKTPKIKDKILFSPSYNVLCQDQVQKWMASLLKKELIPTASTQSLFDAPTSLKLIEEDITSEESERFRFSYAMNLLNWKYLQNKKLNRQESLSVEEIKEDNNIKETGNTASRTLLNYLYNKSNDIKEIAINDLGKIRHVMSPLKIDDEKAKFFLNLIKQEEKHPTKEVFYHGLKKELLYIYHILNIIRGTLNSRDTQLTQLRSTDQFFNQFPTIWHLFQYIESGKTNYSEGFKSAGVSVNPTILSSLDTQTSCTAHYFLNDYSQKAPAIWEVLNVFLKELNLPHQMIIQELQSLYEKALAEQQNGGLIQFFIDPKITNKILYPAGNSGLTIEKTALFKKEQDSQEVLNFFKSDKLFPYNVNKEHLQFRLHAALDQFLENVETRFYYSYKDDKLSATLEKKIARILDKYLLSTLNNSLYSNIYSSHTPSLIEIIRHKEKISPHDSKEDENAIVKDVRRGNYASLLGLYLQSPKTFSFSYVDSDTLEEINLKNVKYCLDNSEEKFLSTINALIIPNVIIKNALCFQSLIIKLDINQKLVLSLTEKDIFSHFNNIKFDAKEFIDIMEDINSLESKEDAWKILEIIKKLNLNSSEMKKLTEKGKQIKNFTKTANLFLDIQEVLNAISGNNTSLVFNFLITNKLKIFDRIKNHKNIKYFLLSLKEKGIKVNLCNAYQNENYLLMTLQRMSQIQDSVKISNFLLLMQENGVDLHHFFDSRPLSTKLHIDHIAALNKAEANNLEKAVKLLFEINNIFNTEAFLKNEKLTNFPYIIEIIQFLDQLKTPEKVRNFLSFLKEEGVKINLYEDFHKNSLGSLLKRIDEVENLPAFLRVVSFLHKEGKFSKKLDTFFYYGLTRDIQKIKNIEQACNLAESLKDIFKEKIPDPTYYTVMCLLEDLSQTDMGIVERVKILYSSYNNNLNWKKSLSNNPWALVNDYAIKLKTVEQTHDLIEATQKVDDYLTQKEGDSNILFAFHYLAKLPPEDIKSMVQEALAREPQDRNHFLSSLEFVAKRNLYF